jgi:hypothetical protein
MTFEKLTSDQTVLWPGRAGDLVIWFRWPGLFVEKAVQVKPIDFWELRDGDRVMLTARWEDLPEPLRSSPVRPLDTLSESGVVLRSLRPQTAKPVEGPHIWRPVVGDRILWTGNRPSSGAVVLGAVECVCGAIVLGEPRDGDRITPTFGAPQGDEASESCKALFAAAHRTLAEAGLPRTLSDGPWRFGR